MAFSFVREAKLGVADHLPTGWQFFSRPTNLEPPGTIFRIDDEGQRFLVHKLPVQIRSSPEPGLEGMQHLETKLGILVRLLGLESLAAQLRSGPSMGLQVEFAEPQRSSTTEAELDRALSAFLPTMEFRPGSRYFVIRESRTTTAVRYRLTDEQMAEIAAETDPGDLVAAGLTLTKSESGGAELAQAFSERKGVMFLAEEIAAVRAGLAGAPPELGRVPVTSSLDWVDPGYAIVRVFFGTDRDVTGDKAPDRVFGRARSDLHYGTCEVSIPRDHRMGEIEGPSVWKFQIREDPTKHVVLLAVDHGPRETMFEALAERVRTSKKRSTFLFVHGYNVSFEGAAKRTAQIAYDLGFDGAPAFYSWPSQGTLAGYIVDEQNVEWAQANLKTFLTELLEYSQAESLYVIAHSMGNRALTRVVAALLTERPALRPLVTEVILTAPDIDAAVFRRDIAPALTGTGRPITLYASSEDVALAASKKIHGYPRAGDSGAGLVIVNGIETIDATDVDTSLIKHGYFAEARAVLSDMFDLVRTGSRAADRFGLREIKTALGRYWKFKK